MDGKEQLAELTQRLTEAEKKLAALNIEVNGELPRDKDVRTVRDRLEVIEREMTASNIVSANPFTQPQAPFRVDHGMPLLDIEGGKPSSSPTGSSATITLQPCEEDGTSYANADTAIVYIRTDRASVDLDRTGWDTDTILSFMRFPLDTTTDSAVGVMIGHGSGEGTHASPYGVTPTGTPDTRTGGSTALTDTWNIDNPQAGTDGVEAWIQVREYFDTGTGTWYYFWRKFTYDSAGALVAISAEEVASES